jgi:hypothetical protein
LARWAVAGIAAIVPQGVALGWMNRWAFGPPSATGTPNTQGPKIINPSLPKKPGSAQCRSNLPHRRLTRSHRFYE